MTDIPDFLLSSARDRARAAASRIAQPATPPQPAPLPAPPVQTASQQPNPPKPAAAKPSPKPLAKAKPGKERRGGNRSGGAEPVAVVPGAVNFEDLADRIVADSSDKATALAVRPALPGVLAALVQGAQMASSVGSADRSMLFRLMKHSSSTAREQAAAAKSIHLHLGAGVEAAISRRRAALNRVVDGESVEVGHAGVTEPARIARKA